VYVQLATSIAVGEQHRQQKQQKYHSPAEFMLFFFSEIFGFEPLFPSPELLCREGCLFLVWGSSGGSFLTCLFSSLSSLSLVPNLCG
jgi:hypothetical protein